MLCASPITQSVSPGAEEKKKKTAIDLVKVKQRIKTNSRDEFSIDDSLNNPQKISTAMLMQCQGHFRSKRTFAFLLEFRHVTPQTVLNQDASRFI